MQDWIQISPKIYSSFVSQYQYYPIPASTAQYQYHSNPMSDPYSVLHILTKFCENWFRSFWVMLLNVKKWPIFPCWRNGKIDAIDSDLEQSQNLIRAWVISHLPTKFSVNLSTSNIPQCQSPISPWWKKWINWSCIQLDPSQNLIDSSLAHASSPTKFHENWSPSFWVISFKDRQTSQHKLKHYLLLRCSLQVIKPNSN